jgi:hypothetical protein
MPDMAQGEPDGRICERWSSVAARCGAGGVLVAEPTEVLAHRYLMHHTTAGWLVAGFGPAPISPGWPPARPPEWDEQEQSSGS